MLGNISQPRVTQLRQQGYLAGAQDPDGKWKYDRESTEALARDRAALKARHAEASEERKALTAEASDRFKRQRALERAAAQARIERLDALQERAVNALEGIYAWLRQQRRSV